MVGRARPPGWQMPTALPFVDLSVDRFFARAIGAWKAKRGYFLVGSLEDCEYPGNRMARLKKKPAEERPVVLLVLSCPERQARLAAILHSLGVDLLGVRQCWEARALLQTRPPLLSVVTDATLEDGNWCDVLRTLVDYDPQAGVILIAPSADEMLWSEAIWRGVHDILVEPFTEAEAQQVVESVLRVAGAQQHSLIGDARCERTAAEIPA